MEAMAAGGSVGVPQAEGGGLKIHSPLPTAVNQSFVAPKKQYGIQHRSDGGGRGGQKEKEREGSNSSEPPPPLESAKG